MKKTHKLLLLLAVVCTLLVCCMMSASAYYTEGIFQYTTNGSDEATIIDLIDNDISGEVVIPETIGGYTVTAIEGTFVDTAVTSVVIPDTVKTIGSDTFMNSKVEKIDLGNGVTTIYDNAFTYAPELVEINIPASVELIVEPMARECPKLQNITVDGNNKNYVSVDGVLYRRQTYFDENGLGLLQYPTGRTDTHFKIPGNAYCIHEGAFFGAYNLTSLDFPKNLMQIYPEAFGGVLQGDLNITDIYYPGTEEEWNSIVIEENNDILSQAEIHLDYPIYYTYTVTNGKAKIVEVDPFIAGDIVIPSTLGGYPVTSIGDMAFRFCSKITSVTVLPNSVKSITGHVFQFCMGLKNVSLPYDIEYISPGAFYGCDNLTSIDVDVRNRNYSSENGILFDKNKTELVCYPAGKTDTAYAIPYGVTTIAHHTFFSCDYLTSITIPNSVTTIEYEAFRTCINLENMIIPDSVTTIGRSAFDQCFALKSITIPESVTTIESSAFSMCYGLESVTLPDSITAISDGTFFACKALTSITIPDSVTTIGEQAFYGCTGLKSATIGDSEAPVATFTLFSRTVSVNEDVVIGKEAFKDCINLKTILLSDKVTQIDVSAFDGCTGLEKIHFEGSEEDWANITGDADLKLEDDVIVCIYNGPIEEHTHNYARVENGDNWNNRCTQKWKEKQHCECGDYKVVEKAAVGHSFTNYKTHKNATCTADAQNIAYCNAGCGASNIKNVAGSKLAHTDNNHDGKCDTCKADTTIGCSCRCHKNDFIWKFLNFFYKLFKMNHYCACGKAHY